jgi:hypothetical protein
MVPEIITIDGLVYYRSADLEGNPSWKHASSGNTVLYLNNDWIIRDSSGQTIKTSADSWTDTTSPNVFITTCSSSFSAIDVVGAGINDINTSSPSVFTGSKYTPQAFNSPVFGKSYNKWIKGNYVIVLEAFRKESTKLFRWKIMAAGVPHNLAIAYYRDFEVDMGTEPDGIACPPTTGWLTWPGSNAGTPPTISFRPCISCPNLTISPL